MARGLDKAQNRILTIAIDGDDATVRPMRRDRHPVCLDAFASEARTNPLAKRVVADRSDEANKRAAPRRDDRLTGALAAEIFRRSERHDCLAGPWEPHRWD